MPERNGNGLWKMAATALATGAVATLVGWGIGRSEGAQAINEVKRRLDVAERYAEEYRDDVSQINSRIASIDSKVAVIESRLRKKGD